MTAIENDLAFSRQMAELNAMLAAVTATCRAAEAEAISLRDQLAAERKAREDLEKGWQRTYNHDCTLLIKRAETAEAKCSELEYWRKEHASADFAWKIDFERAETARSDALEEAAKEMDAWDKQTVCTIRPAAAIRALKEVP